MSPLRGVCTAIIALFTNVQLAAAQPKPAFSYIGNYQGTVATTPTPRRLILRVFEGPDHRLAAYLVKLDQGGMDNRQIADTVQGTANGLRLVFKGRTRYETMVGNDGATVTGAYKRDSTSLSFTLARTTPEAEFRDSKAGTVKFVTVAPGVQLEVLDWGGTGRPLVLLAGLGSGAHVFNTFASKLATNYHVIGISRRGYGASSIPSSGYRTDTLANDVLAVLDSLKISKPVLAGWSFGGGEMSSIASRFPERVAGLVYLDAGYSYAYYDSKTGDPEMGFLTSASVLRHELEALTNPFAPIPPKEQIARFRVLLEQMIPDVQRDMQAMMPLLAKAPEEKAPDFAYEAVPEAMLLGTQKHARLTVPTLAIFAYPHAPPPGADSATKAIMQVDDRTKRQSTAFEKGVPSAKVVRIPNASHAVFESHPAEVLKEMQAFIDGLAKK